MQTNSIIEKSHFSQLKATLDRFECPQNPQNIIIANENLSTTFTSITQKLGNYAKYQKQVIHTKPQELPIVAG